LPTASTGLYLLWRARRCSAAAPKGVTSILREVVLVLLLALMSGCQTGRSFDQGCPGVYSGVRYYADQIGETPFDGKIFFTFDLPLSAVLDTLLLPATAFIEPERPEYGWPVGCRWAAR
jgi:uncharacterized protein YceK